MSLKKCKECGQKVSSKAEVCPHCGAKVKRQPMGCLTGIFVLIGIIWFASTLDIAHKDRKRADNEQRIHAEKIDYFNANKPAIIATIEKQIEKGQFNNALIQINEYKSSGDADLLSYWPQVREQVLLAELKPLPVSQYQENLTRYQELLQLRPDDTKYKAKVAFYKGKIDQQKKEQQARIAKYGEPPKASSYDGTYYVVEHYLKTLAHDPDSIDITACSKVYFREDSGWEIQCEYRGKNTFGALIRKLSWFTIAHDTVVDVRDSQ